MCKSSSTNVLVIDQLLSFIQLDTRVTGGGRWPLNYIYCIHDSWGAVIIIVIVVGNGMGNSCLNPRQGNFALLVRQPMFWGGNLLVAKVLDKYLVEIVKGKNKEVVSNFQTISCMCLSKPSTTRRAWQKINFKRSTAGLNSEFSFFKSGCRTKVLKNLLYLLLSGWMEMIDSHLS